jgi:very-short-patch-repair endonuclease
MELNNHKVKFDHDFLNLVFNNTHAYEVEKIESPIEQILLNHLIKYLDLETEVLVQTPFSTVSGNFRTDIILKKDDKKVVLECDGEEFHTKEDNEWYDEWRDALLLKHEHVETIYRIKGKTSTQISMR